MSVDYSRNRKEAIEKGKVEKRSSKNMVNKT